MKRLIPLALTVALSGFAQTPPVVAQMAPATAQTEAPPRVGVTGTVNLSLKEAIEKVLVNDQALVISRIDRTEATFNLTSAQGAYDPHLGFTGYRTRAVTPVASLFGGAANGKVSTETIVADPQVSGLFPAFGGSYKLDFASTRQNTDSTINFLNPQYNTSLNLNLTQPLWRGLHFDDNRYRIQVARKNIDLSVEQLRQQVIATVSQTIQAYWELQFALSNLDVQTQAVRLAEQQDASNRRQVEQGLLAEVDVVQSQAQIASFQQNMLIAQQSVTVAENALKVLLLADRNDPMWGVSIVPEILPDEKPAPMSVDEAMKLALELRPELNQSMIELSINQLDVRRTREQTKPQIDAIAGLTTSGLAGTQTSLGSNGGLIGLLPPGAGIPPVLIGGYGQSLSNLASGHYTTATVGVTFSLPLRNRTAESQLAVAGAETKKLEATRRQIELVIEQDVRNALQAVTSARARAEAAGKARSYSEDQYASEQRQFQAGTSTVFLVLQRQTDLIVALTREARAKADLGEAAANLDRATARTLEVRNIEVR
jgi:HAE1 family hydrophobic/amphiphilic exporter-1